MVSSIDSVEQAAQAARSVSTCTLRTFAKIQAEDGVALEPAALAMGHMVSVVERDRERVLMLTVAGLPLRIAELEGGAK